MNVTKGLLILIVMSFLVIGCGDDSTTAPSVPPVPAELLGEAVWTTGGGIAAVGYDGFDVSFGIYTTSNYQTSVPDLYFFQDVLMQRGDIGDSLIIDSENCVDFLVITDLIANGIDDRLGLLTPFSPDGNMSRGARSESYFWAGGLDGQNNPDFAGYEITQVVAYVDELFLTTPGTNPNGNGIWTDYRLGVRFAVMGRPSPE